MSTKLPGQYPLCQKCVARRIVIKKIFKNVNTNRNCGLRREEKTNKDVSKKKKKRIERSKENDEKIQRHVRICQEGSKALEMVIIKGC